MSISLSNVLNLLQNGHFPISAYFGDHFCYHNKGKSLINTRLLHLGYCSNKLIKHTSEKQLGGPKYRLNAHTPFILGSVECEKKLISGPGLRL